MMLILFARAILIALFTREMQAISSSWRPVIAPVHTDGATGILHQEASIFGNTPTQTLYDVDNSHLLLSHDHEQCSLYKVAMNQQLYFEYIHYKTELPDMKEFTLCMWTKFYNHSNDHPLFSYAVGDQPRGILSWIANTPRSSYYMFNINGHNLYRLNYPLRLNKWYHSCQSWNGRTGEWQIWVNDERVGRGFNNRLVGHVIKGGGIAISGQEQRQLGGGFLEGEGAPRGSGGYLGELTMVQLYNVALTAGKAHKDHKHHHAHHYEHDTSNNTPRTTTQPPITGPPLPPHPLLTGGQINAQVKINPGASIQIVQNGVTIRHPALPPVPESPPQPLPPLNLDVLSTAFPALATSFIGNPAQQLPTVERPSSIFPDESYHNLFKRERGESKKRNIKDEAMVSSLTESVVKRDIKKVSQIGNSDGKISFVPQSETADDKKLGKREAEKKKKRGLLQLSDGSIFDDGYAIPQRLDNDYFTGLTSFGLELVKETDEENVREPAEGEVRLVMDICDGCTDEPFGKALIIGWRTVPKKLYSGALFLPAIQACKAF